MQIYQNLKSETLLFLSTSDNEHSTSIGVHKCMKGYIPDFYSTLLFPEKFL
jgi:hypothetical protein